MPEWVSALTLQTTPGRTLGEFDAKVVGRRAYKPPGKGAEPPSNRPIAPNKVIAILGQYRPMRDCGEAWTARTSGA